MKGQTITLTQYIKGLDDESLERLYNIIRHELLDRDYKKEERNDG